MKNVAALTEDEAFALFFRPHPGGFESPSPLLSNTCHAGCLSGGVDSLYSFGILCFKSLGDWKLDKFISEMTTQ